MKLKNLPTLTYTNIHICNYRAWFTYFKQNKTTPSKHNVTKENWLNDPYLRWSYTHMKEFTLVNNVKQS